MAWSVTSVIKTPRRSTLAYTSVLKVGKKWAPATIRLYKLRCLVHNRGRTPFTDDKTHCVARYRGSLISDRQERERGKGRETEREREREREREGDI